ncbi:MAG TPA: MetQ/NlpA family ABC transporter substrate-binding protein [Pseudomonas sp.]|nr:MetQ/NlpA family ABC transporter substrate-binding protein [Pseudomonas sp.]
MKLRTLLHSLLHPGVGLLGAALFSLAAEAGALKIGVTPGALADSIHVAAREAKSQGLEVEVVEFSDWITPNLALASKDLDANYFQHQAFLDNAIKERGYKLKSVGLGILSNIGLYSTRIKSFAELKDGARVAVANDPVNQGRGLLLLQSAGLVKLREGVGSHARLSDIVANPKHLKLVEIEGPQLVRAIDDVDLAQGYPAHLVAAGTLDPGSALLFSGVDDVYYAIRFVAREDNAADPRLQQFIRLYQESPAVRVQIKKSNADNERLYTLPWLQNATAAASVTK